MTSPTSGAPRTISLVPWRDNVVEQTGYDLRHMYVEHFWLPVLGPTCLVMLRRAAEIFDTYPSGCELELTEFGAQLGIVYSGAPKNAVSRSIDRLVRFEFARQSQIDGQSTLAIRRSAPPLAPRHINRLPASVRDALAAWCDERGAAQMPIRCASNSR